MAVTQKSIQSRPVSDVRLDSKRQNYRWGHVGAYLCKTSLAAWRAYQGYILVEGKNRRRTIKRSTIRVVSQTNEKKGSQEKTVTLKIKEGSHKS